MNPVTALALRRTMIVTGAIGSAMVAHTAVSAQLLVTPATPAWVGVLVFLVMLLGRRTGWRRRGIHTTALLLAGLQAVTHLAMGVAPWAFGLDVHHLGAVVTPEMLIAHALALGLTAWLISVAERLMDAALHTAAVIARALGARRRRARPAARILPTRLPSAPPEPTAAVRHCRGPPSLALS